jgi:small-conductance mechanosensitive channel
MDRAWREVLRKPRPSIRAERVLSEIVKSHELVLDDPEPIIRLNNLGDSSVDFIARPWTKTDDYWTVYWDITREVKKRFDAEGISIPFPQRDVHLYQEAVAAAPKAEAVPPPREGSRQNPVEADVQDVGGDPEN